MCTLLRRLKGKISPRRPRVIQLDGGPAIRGVNVQGWSADPAAPSKPIGGVNGIQTLTAFSPVEDLIGQVPLDKSFRQQDLRSFSAGGQISGLKPDDLPEGFFLSFKGHPIFKVTKVQYPIGERYPPIVGPRKMGVRITFNFWHEPGNGERYQATFFRPNAPGSQDIRYTWAAFVRL